MSFSISRDATAGLRLPRGINIRRGTTDDEIATFDVMRRAMGFDISWANHAAARQHLRASPHSSYWLAEETPRFGRSRIIGYAHSVMREGVWHLTEFFVLPSHHRQGIGGVLLDRCLEDSARAGAHTRFVLASQHPSANALYVRKADCFPRLPMFLLAGPTLALHAVGTRDTPISEATLPASATSFFGVSMPQKRAEGQELRAEPIVRKPEVQIVLDSLDRDAIGFARPPEHTHWIEEMGGTRGASRLFRRADNDQIVGYAYYGRQSSGPAVALDPADLPRMLAHVTSVARHNRGNSGEAGLIEAAEPYWAVPGTNEIVLRWLLYCGWQIVFQYLFMSSRPMGQLERYVCHNPLHFL